MPKLNQKPRYEYFRMIQEFNGDVWYDIKVYPASEKEQIYNDFMELASQNESKYRIGNRKKPIQP